MNMLDFLVIAASFILVLGMVIFIDHDQKTIQNWLNQPAKVIVEENNYICQPQFEEQSAGQVLTELRLLSKFMQTFEVE